LSDEGSALRCARCDLRYPLLGTIPCLLERPSSAVHHFRGMLHELATGIELERDRLLADLAGGEAKTGLTRKRLELQRQALATTLEQILELFGSAGIEPRARSEALPPMLALSDGALAYHQQLHRDWGWPQREIEAALACIAGVLAGRQLGRTLFLGAGGCRLVRELHLRHGATHTIATDINPLPFFVAARILRGQPVSLFEIPSSPRSVDQSAVNRVLGDGLAPVAEIELVFADALSPPFAEGSFDTVVTAWFLDQVVADLPAFIPVVRSLLASGGAWLNHGPLVYPQGTPRRSRYTVEELLELVANAGFQLHASDTRELDFMHSPICNQGRSERVLSFLATRVEQAPLAASVPAAPAWLSDPSLPVPLVEAFQAYVPPHPFFAAVVALVDGRRSAGEIAERLAHEQGQPVDAMQTAVLACLHEVTRRG